MPQHPDLGLPVANYADVFAGDAYREAIFRRLAEVRTEIRHAKETDTFSVVGVLEAADRKEIAESGFPVRLLAALITDGDFR